MKLPFYIYIGRSLLLHGRLRRRLYIERSLQYQCANVIALSMARDRLANVVVRRAVALVQ